MDHAPHNLPCIIPDACHLRRQHMRDIAADTVHDAARLHRLMALFLLPNGEVKRAGNETARCRDLLKRHRLSLVGIYTDDAAIEDIIEDLMCMERVN